MSNVVMIKPSFKTKENSRCMNRADRNYSISETEQQMFNQCVI